MSRCFKAIGWSSIFSTCIYGKVVSQFIFWQHAHLFIQAGGTGAPLSCVMHLTLPLFSHTGSVITYLFLPLQDPAAVLNEVGLLAGLRTL